MTRMPMSTSPRRRLPVVPGVAILALVLVASIWAATYFSAEARMRRATARVVRLVEKSAEESAVALGLSASRLGDFLAADAVLALEGYGPLATGRSEIVQLYANVRNSLEIISFENPRISAVAVRGGEVQAFVDARYRLASVAAGAAQEGDGKATLHWAKGADGWQIVRANLTPDPAAAVSGNWP